MDLQYYTFGIKIHVCTTSNRFYLIYVIKSKHRFEENMSDITDTARYVSYLDIHPVIAVRAGKERNITTKDISIFH